jgi:hypothetical protein
MANIVHAMGDGLEVFIIFLGMSTPVIVVGLIYYLKKRLEHKQIMAAIEKGVPFSTISPPKQAGPAWIRNFTAGIALLVIAAGFVCIVLICRGDFDDREDMFGYFIVALMFFALGISRLIRGLLQRKSSP